jgi:putative ABC transport system permease protein
MDPEYNWIPIEYYSIRFNMHDITLIINESKKIWNEFFPESSFDYFFLDAFYDQQYKLDVQYGKIITVFSLIAIFIAVLGLLGLSIYSTSQRIKEIGIRKVLGAPGMSIYHLLVKEIVILVIISSIIAIPTTWFVMNKWLNSYAFKIDPPLWTFLLPVFIIMLISISTVSNVILKATRTNPASILRYE